MMIIAILSWCCAIAFPFFMYFTVKRLTEIRDLLKEQNNNATKEETD